MSPFCAAEAVTVALDASRENEVVVVNGEQVTRVPFDELDARAQQLVAMWGIRPMPWPRRWLLEDFAGELMIYDVQRRRERAFA